MTKFALALVGAMSVMFGVPSPAGAITYGEPDDGAHPYVGFMISFNPSGPGWSTCSGSLLDADTSLTAGHCAYGIGTGGQVVQNADEAVVTSGGTDLWVTFDDTDVLAGWPARADYPTAATLYDARSAWLDANPH